MFIAIFILALISTAFAVASFVLAMMDKDRLSAACTLAMAVQSSILAALIIAWDQLESVAAAWGTSFDNLPIVTVSTAVVFLSSTLTAFLLARVKNTVLDFIMGSAAFASSLTMSISYVVYFFMNI